jgi:hypothetical protein
MHCKATCANPGPDRFLTKAQLFRNFRHFIKMFHCSPFRAFNVSFSPLTIRLSGDMLRAMKARATSLRDGLKRVTAPAPKTPAELEQQVRSGRDSDAFLAVEWLNAAKGTAAYRRVLAVRRELEELGTILDSLRGQRQAWKNRRAKSDAEILENLKASTSMAELQEQFRERHNALNQTIARYAFVPALGYNLDSGFWRFSAIPKHIRGPEIKVENQDTRIRVRVNEASVVAALARLASIGELYKARLCEQCGKRWVFSLRAMDKFCSEDCRKYFHVHSEEGKQKNRDRQKAYRNSSGYTNAIG